MLLRAACIAWFLLTGSGTDCLGQDRYQIHPELSEITFSIRHLGVLTVDGVFNEITGDCSFEEDMLVSFNSRVDVDSIDTSNISRDQTLLEEAYLDAGRFPHIIFYSEAITAKKITGRLKIKGVERHITVSYRWEDSEESGYRLLKSNITIKREDFQLDFGSMDSLVGNEITVQIAIAIYKD